MDKITSYNINSLRWYLCLTVVIGHVFKLFFDVYDNHLINWSGFIAVCGFLFISGYVNHNSLSQAKDPLLFLKNRSKRILGPFYLALISGVSLYLIFGIELKKDILYNFLMLHHIFGFETIGSNAPLWTISYEFWLYFVFALSFNSKLFKLLSFLLACCFLVFLNNSYYFIFYTLFSLGAILSHYKIKLNVIKIPFFISKNWTYEVYLFHYPLFILILRLMS